MGLAPFTKPPWCLLLWMDAEPCQDQQAWKRTQIWLVMVLSLGKE